MGVARLISSASTIWAKIGPAMNWNCAAAVLVLHDDVGADDVGGHQVGRELDAVELQVQRLRQRADQGGLAEAGHAFEQRVAADEEAREHAVDDLLVADDRLGDLGLHGAVVAAERFAHRVDLRVDAGDGWLGHGFISCNSLTVTRSTERIEGSLTNQKLT